jgi:hypothetical protein
MFELLDDGADRVGPQVDLFFALEYPLLFLVGDVLFDALPQRLEQDVVAISDLTALVGRR